MKSSQHPGGPAEPTKRERDTADQREQLDETLVPQAERNPREGHQSTRNRPSPQGRNESAPTAPNRRQR